MEEYRLPWTVSDDVVSFAFADDWSGYTNCPAARSIDLYDTGVEEVTLDHHATLERLRLSHCHNLKEVHLRSIPWLTVLDISDAPELTTLTIVNCPALTVVDASFCTKLTNFPSLPNLKYLDLHDTSVSTLETFPLLQFLDVSDTKCTALPPLSSLQELEYLIVKSTADLEGLKALPKFRKLQFRDQQWDIKHLAETPTQVFPYQIWPPLRETSTGNTSTGTSTKEKETESPGFTRYQRMLYGPWGAPPGDVCRGIVEEPVVECPCNPVVARECIYGCLFGSALGDCLGLFAEGSGPEFLQFALEKPMAITWDHPFSTKRGTFFHRGSFTDDTALAICFMKAMVETGGVLDPLVCGKHIKNWIIEGMPEHHDGFGIGQGPSTAHVCRTQGFDEDPIRVAHEFWLSTNKFSSGNGGVMRTGPVGCYCFWDEKTVINNARVFCMVTHASPLCVFSSVCISLIIARLIQHNAKMIKKFDLDKTIKDALRAVPELTKEDIKLLSPFLVAKTTDQLHLLEQVSPTLITLGCGIFVLRKNYSYIDGISTIILAGGDTDTNAAVVGAVLGARWGFSSIPPSIITHFWFGSCLHKYAVPFLHLMGLEPADT